MSIAFDPSNHIPAYSEPETFNENNKENVAFVDEIIIDDQNILTISVEKMFEEQPRRARKSRWGEKPEKRPKQEVNYQFDPLEAMMNRKAIMPMNNTVGINPINPLSFIIPGYSNFSQVTEERPSSRWGPEHEKTFQPPSLNAIPPGLSIDDFEYIIRLYCLDEVYQKIQRPAADPKTEDKDLRSPSPEPVYDTQGRRLNTRDQRRKDQLFKGKVSIIEECMKMRKTFVPPNDYRPLKKQRKIYLQESYYTPDINYIGLIIGPKGQTQKMLENKTGCKISIRGKGASKTKRVELDSDDKLHVLIQADGDENLDKGIGLVEKLLRGEDEDEFKRNQRLQLQVVSGVLRDDFCELCHEKGHRSWACPSKLAWTKADVKCEICGERSHPTSDCPKKGVNKSAYIQSEYNKMMNEVDMKPVHTAYEERDKPKERLNFITEASFTGFNLQQQLEADPEIMAEMKKQEQERKQEQQAQLNALQNFTLNNKQFTVTQYTQEQHQIQNQQYQQMNSQYPGMGYGMYGINQQFQNPMMPMMGMGFGQQQIGYGSTNQLALTAFDQSKKLPLPPIQPPPQPQKNQIQPPKQQ